MWKRLTEPLTATVIQAVVMWLWHAPSLFDRALDSRGGMSRSILASLLASLLFWVAMFRRRHGGYLLSAACLFVTSMVEGALGALMALSTVLGTPLMPQWAFPASGLILPLTSAWPGLSSIPGGAVHGAVAISLLYRWLSSEGGRTVHVR